MFSPRSTWAVLEPDTLAKCEGRRNRRAPVHRRRVQRVPGSSTGCPREFLGSVHRGISCTRERPSTFCPWRPMGRSSVPCRSSPRARVATYREPGRRGACCASSDTRHRPSPSPVGRSSCRDPPLSASRQSGFAEASRQGQSSLLRSRVNDPHLWDPLIRTIFCF